MNATTLSFWFCALLNVGLNCALGRYFRQRVKAQDLSESKAKSLYTWLCLAVGILSGTVAFFGIVVLFNIPLGHGEIIIATPIFNFLLAGILVIAGRIVIGWTPMKW